jgi:integrase
VCTLEQIVAKKVLTDAVVLTDPAIRRYKPAGERRRIRDLGAKSLFLIIEPSGHKAFQMRFRTPSGRIGKLTLGPFDPSGSELEAVPTVGQPLTLAAARTLAVATHRQRALGHDPIADHKARKHRQRIEIEEHHAGTFVAAVRAYIDEHAKPETRNWRETARLLGLDYPLDGGEPQETKGGLAQRWADKPVREIDGHDIWSVVDEAKRIGVPGIKARNKGLSEPRGRMLFVALSSLFGWLKKNRKVEINPAASVSRPEGAKARERVLSADEIRWFWAACDTVDAPRMTSAPRPFAPLLKILLLTGARLNEVAGMIRSELIEDGMTWSLPGSRTKNKRPHVVPLSPLVRELIASVKGRYFVFSTTGHSPPSGWSRMKLRLDAEMLAVARKERGKDVSIAPWRLHDLRRTAVTNMGELGVLPHVVEKVVNHVSGHQAGVAGVYNKSELIDERRAALERWTRFAALVIDRDLYAAHQTFVASGAKAREAFNAAVAGGGERWSRYLKTITIGGQANVVNLSRRREK